MLQPHGQCLPPSSLEDFINLAKACYMSLQPLELAPAAAEIRQKVVDIYGRGVPPSHESKRPGSGQVSASRIAEIRQKVVDKYGRGVLPSHESKSPRSGEVSSAAPAALSSPGSGEVSSAAPAASSSSAAAAVPSQILVEFRQAGWAPHWTVVPAHFTSLEVANILEAEGCVGAYEHISRGPWGHYTMEELMLDPNHASVIFS